MGQRSRSRADSPLRELHYRGVYMGYPYPCSCLCAFMGALSSALLGQPLRTSGSLSACGGLKSWPLFRRNMSRRSGSPLRLYRAIFAGGGSGLRSASSLSFSAFSFCSCSCLRLSHLVFSRKPHAIKAGRYAVVRLPSRTCFGGTILHF